jgi:hypothetical protein
VCTLEWDRVNLGAIKYCKKWLIDYEVQMNDTLFVYLVGDGECQLTINSPTLCLT